MRQQTTAKVSPEQMPASTPDEGITPTIFGMIAQFEHIEDQCEKALERQQELSRAYYRSVDQRQPKGHDQVEVKSGEMRDRADMSIGDISFRDFRELRGIARSVVPSGLPNANRRFVINACTPAFVEIEEIEESIKLYRYRMSVLEHDILEFTPVTPAEACAKLTFTASLLLDGGNVDIDYFAYLVEECAFVIASKLTPL